MKLIDELQEIVDNIDEEEVLSKSKYLKTDESDLVLTREAEKKYYPVKGSKYHK